MNEGISLKATAHVKLVKYDENNNIVEVVDSEIELTEKEAEEVWRLQQQV